jgi:hypothetical protein
MFIDVDAESLQNGCALIFEFSQAFSEFRNLRIIAAGQNQSTMVWLRTVI